ncbi:DUF2089 family protein [Tepidibacter sp. Z1-5]|uniref:DUF2089 family protein n=1 Tax=Tepidibacter sp. Z1-5 TaxID=3134138 RepID=UPI0030C0DE54
MKKELVGHCPRCSDKLIVTRLICKKCDLELTGGFGLSKFDYLSSDEMDFVLTFLKYQGNFRAVQEQKGMSYPAVKKKIREVIMKLGIDDIEDKKEEVSDMARVNFLAIESNDSLVVTRIKEKLNNCGGKATIQLLQGDPCDIWYDANGKGLVSPKIPPANQLVWGVFDAAVEVVINNGGKAIKGKARSGAKLGSDDLPLDSIEGYIAHKVHGVQEGETAFGPGFVIAAVLDWAEICNNKRGYISIKHSFFEDYKEDYKNER